MARGSIKTLRGVLTAAFLTGVPWHRTKLAQLAVVVASISCLLRLRGYGCHISHLVPGHPAAMRLAEVPLTTFARFFAPGLVVFLPPPVMVFAVCIWMMSVPYIVLLRLGRRLRMLGMA